METLHERAHARNRPATAADDRRLTKPPNGSKLRQAPWDAPSWREAAVAYHKDRNGRRLSVEIDPKHLARLRRLISPEISLDRAWHELNNKRPTPAVTVEAIKQAVRERGLAALKEPAVRGRVQRCDDASLAIVNEWLADFKKKSCP